LFSSVLGPFTDYAPGKLLLALFQSISLADYVKRIKKEKRLTLLQIQNNSDGEIHWRESGEIM